MARSGRLMCEEGLMSVAGSCSEFQRSGSERREAVDAPAHIHIHSHTFKAQYVSASRWQGLPRADWRTYGAS